MERLSAPVIGGEQTQARFADPPSERIHSSTPPRIAFTIAVLAAITVALAIYFLRLDSVFGLFKDDGWYLVLAKALATGHGYNLINLPHSGHYFYPPVYPFLLSLLYRVGPAFPSNVVILKSVSIVAMLVLAITVFKLFDRPGRLPRSLALLVAVCTALAPGFVMLATSSLMSECVFTMLQFGALLFADRCISKYHETRSAAWATALLTAAAFLTRVAGIGLLTGLAFVFLRRRMFRELGILASTALVCAGSWFLYTRMTTNPTQVAPGYLAQFWTRRAGASSETVSMKDLPARTWQQATMIAADDIGALFAPSLYRTGSESGEELRDMPEAIPWLRLNSDPLAVPTMGLPVQGQLVSFGFFLVILTGFIVSVRRGFGPIDSVFVFNLLIIVLWPWNPIRFLLPLFPILLYYLILGIEKLSRAFQNAFKMRAYPYAWSASRVVILCILGLFLFDHCSYLIAKRAVPGSQRYPDWLVQFDAERQASLWVRDHTTPAELVSGDNMPVLYFYSERQTEICRMRECAQKGVRYRFIADGAQGVEGKVVFESRGITVLDMSHPER